MVCGELNTIMQLKLRSKQTGNEYEVECRRHVEVHAWSKVLPNRVFTSNTYYENFSSPEVCAFLCESLPPHPPCESPGVCLSVRKSFQVVHKGFETSLDVFDN